MGEVLQPMPGKSDLEAAIKALSPPNALLSKGFRVGCESGTSL
jgi:hypothetical protein